MQHADPTIVPAEAAFQAICALLEDFAVPVRLQSELYGVLASLPGMRFDASIHDGAGRPGVGLYIIEGGWLKFEMVVNRATYAYMGQQMIAVRAHTERCTGMCWPAITRYHEGESLGWSAQLAQGIVLQAGQVPGRRSRG